VEQLIHHGVGVVAIKEGIVFEGKLTMQTKAMIALFGLLAEVERDLIAERTREGLAAARAKGKHLGRPKDTLP
jgi:DNA invertase Pin-like site-specific DNA recombinase